MKRPDKPQEYLEMMAQQQLALQLVTYDSLVRPEPKWHPSFSIATEEQHEPHFFFNQLTKH